MITCPYRELAATWPQVEGWLIDSLLGEGGMGGVFRATPVAGGEPVALKLLDPKRTGPAQQSRLLTEARAMALVRHEHLARCLDVGVVQGIPFLALELATGGDAEELRLTHPQGMPLGHLLDIALQSAQGLVVLHAAKIIHRDLKPSNILLTAEGRAMLADFGLAHLMDDDAPGVTKAGFTVGTPEYMSPEQARAVADLDGRTDLYSLGATLYALATGRPPHEGATAWAVLSELLAEPFPDPRLKRIDLSEGLAQVIRRLGAKDRAHRYADAQQVVTDLELLKAGRMPVHAGPPLVERTTSAFNRPTDRPVVLVVDDDALVRRLYQAGLNARGFRVVTAPDGAEAIQLAEQHAMAAAVVDLVLPDMPGTEVVRRIAARMPVVVLSNAFDEQQLQAARAAGAQRVLPKSSTPPAALAEELSRILSRPGSQTRIAEVDPTQALAAADAGLARVQVLLGNLKPDGDERMLEEIAATARGISAAAGAAGATAAATLSAALEALARELILEPRRRSESSRCTLSQAATALRSLLLHPSCVTRDRLVLGVDDDRIARAIIGRSLERVSLRYQLAANADEAMRMLAQRQYDLVITDVVMEGLNGFQLAGRIRALPNQAKTPIVFVTGMNEFSSFFSAGPGSNTDLIGKPYLPMELAVKSLVLLAGS